MFRRAAGDLDYYELLEVSVTRKWKSHLHDPCLPVFFDSASNFFFPYAGCTRCRT